MSRTNPVYRARLDHYAARFEAFAASRSEDPAWLIGLRSAAMARFQELGFPSPRLEAWRYTNVAAIASLALERQEGSAEIQPAEAASLSLGNADRILVSSGRACAPGATISGVCVESIALLCAEDPDRLEMLLGRRLDPKDRSFALLNTAFLEDGLVVSVLRDAAPERPIHLLVFEPGGGAGGAISHPRLIVTAEPGSRATLVVDHVSPAHHGDGPVLTNCVTEVSVAANASLDLVLLQRERDGCFHVSTTAANVERDGRFGAHTLTLGGALVRNDLEVVLADEGAECDLRGLFFGSAERLIDNHTSIDHAMPHGSSRELYKGILGDHSKGVFRGRIIVRPGAQKTDAIQSNRNLLLGPGAEIDTKPQLEIYADDVKCAHGATIGQLDADALFYLRSRGIGEADARGVLTEAFANEIAAGIPDAELAGAVRGLVSTALRGITSQAAGVGR